jgi:hypothetical protein
MDELNQVFDQFCAFGGGKSSSGNLASGAQMTGANFAKFCKDCNLIKGKITTVEVDITFSKVLIVLNRSKAKLNAKLISINLKLLSGALERNFIQIRVRQTKWNPCWF